MSATRILAIAAALMLMSAPVLAQTKTDTKQPTKTTEPAPAAKAPAAKSAAPTATTPAAKKVNLNTATAEELDGLPQIGPARAKAIIEARGKSKFKNWDDFVARNVIPSNAETAIKSLVSF